MEALTEKLMNFPNLNAPSGITQIAKHFFGLDIWKIHDSKKKLAFIKASNKSPVFSIDYFRVVSKL